MAVRVSYKWILDYVDCPWEPEELAERLTMSGLMVERMEKLGEGLEGIVTARVLSIEPHPDADTLFVARVDGGDGPVTVVTGATNVAAGDVVPLARPGTRLPGGQVIERVTLRGVPSEGMMCSEAELGLGDDASGIMILPGDTPVGKLLHDVLSLDDVVFEVEVHPNRPDCLGVIGIAREVAALCGQPLRLPPDDYSPIPTTAASAVNVAIEDDALCRRYIAHVAEGLRIGPSPLWLQQRLRVAGMRPINNVVDITNFVMWEWGQPLHAFDYTTLLDQRIIVRRAREGERIVALDGRERALTTDMLVIADGRRPVAIAGVMGGAETEVTPDSTTILLESAHFHAASIRRTARHLGMRTEASQRFEKGLDPELPLPAARRALHLMERLAGARVYSGMVDAYPRPVTPRTIVFSPARVNRFLGVAWEPQEMVDILQRLQFQVRPASREARALEGGGAQDDVLRDDVLYEVDVPSFRGDVEQEADLAEEIVRMKGFDAVPATLPEAAAEPGGLTERQRALQHVRDVLVGMGLLEAINYSFVSPRVDDQLLLPDDHPWRRHIALVNPLSEEQSVMRTNLLGGLLEAAARNLSRRVRDIHLFEMGAAFEPGEDGQPVETDYVAILMAGQLPERTWGHGRARQVDFFALKGVVEELARALRVDVAFRRGEHPSFHPGRQADIVAGGQVIGILGEVHPRVLSSMEAPKGTCAAHIHLDGLLQHARALPRFQGLPRYPAVRRDLALLVPKDHGAAAVEQVIRRAAGSALASITLFDVYEGPQIPEGYRSLAYALDFRAEDRTMTDDEVHRLIEQVEKALQAEMGVTIRR